MLHLFRFHHGLGDAVQFTVVLRHLAELRPDWKIDVQTQYGPHSLFAGLVRSAFTDDRPPDPRAYDSVQDLAWPEPWQCYPNSPATKAERSLREVFGLQPVERLCRYHVQPTPDAELRGQEYLERTAKSMLPASNNPLPSRERVAAQPPGEGAGAFSIFDCGVSIAGQEANAERGPRFNAALIHYQGNSARSRKNIDERIIGELIRSLRQRGLTPVLLDWDRRSDLARTGAVENAAADERLWRSHSTGDGATLAALIARVRLFVGIDSGPGHIAGATDTPSIIVWRRHHPLHFYGLSANVTHLVPEDHALFLHNDQEAGARYFAARYQHRIYRDLQHSLPRLARELLDAQLPPAIENRKSKIENYSEAAPLRGDKPRGSELHPAIENPKSKIQNALGLILDLDHWLRPQHRTADAAVVREVYLDDCYRCGEFACRPRTIVDVGSHIGTFARRMRQQFPQAKIVCVEANPANIEALSANVAEFAVVLPAACTYERTPQRLLSSVFAGSENTGASRLTPRDNWSWDQQTYRDAGDVPTITLEEIQASHGWPRIDLLKLDCEGSEFSILEQCDLSRVGLIVGEYHGRERFHRLVRRRFYDWRLRILRDGEIGLFWLSPPGLSAETARGELSAADFQARWQICTDCDQLQGNCCTMTGTNVRRDARRTETRCPMGKWRMPIADWRLPNEEEATEPRGSSPRKDAAEDFAFGFPLPSRERVAAQPSGEGAEAQPFSMLDVGFSIDGSRSNVENGALNCDVAQLQDFLRTRADGGTLLLRFPHGLGDHVQLTGVLLHLRRRFPQLLIDIACRAGAESMFAGLCRRAVRLGSESPGDYDHAITLRWPEPNRVYSDSPSTKAERALREVFDLQPDPALCRYQIAAEPAAEQRAADYLQRIVAAGRAVLFHYQGRCGRRLKDIDESIVRAAMQAARAAGSLSIVLDWNGDNSLVRDGLALNAASDIALWESPGAGDAATIAALARQSQLCIGIDSGPGHVFAATETPTIIVWKLLHPLNYFPPTSLATHWAPAAHGRFIRGRRPIGEAYFAQHYRHHIYRDLATELPAEVTRRLEEGL